MAEIRIARPNIGLKRISVSTNASFASATRDVRAQMEVIKDNLQTALEGIKNATVAATKYALQPIYEKSQVYVPVKTGRLKSSGYLEARRVGSIIQAEVGYAKGGNPPYAALVHENLAAPHRPPTMAKFLQQAVNEHLHEVRPRLIEAISLGSGLRK